MPRMVPTLLLLAYGGAFAAAAFGRGLPAFDDHPGQYFRLWHALERSLPAAAWTADWNPDWWGGYPEFQFYPPGFALLGATIRLLALWQLPVEQVYQLLCAVTLLLPAVGTYRLLTALLGDRWLALPPAVLALTLSAGLTGGVEEGLRWGMVTTRLSVGVLPFVVLAVRPWIERGQPPSWAPLAVAAAVLAHPASGVAVLAILATATLIAVALRPARAGLAHAAVVGLLATGLTAFWTLPLLWRRAYVVPLAWGEPTLGGLVAQARAYPILLGLALAAPLAWIAVWLRRRPLDVLVALLPLIAAGALALDAILFTRGLSPIEPARLLDGVALAAIWAAGLGVGILALALTESRPRGAGRPALAVGLVVALALLPHGPGGQPGLTLWPRAGHWPHIGEVAGDLAPLWAALRGRPDRVLFLTSSRRLGTEPAWYAAHSHVWSLTPLYTGREIVHGTFTHPAPLAARFYLGTDPPARLTVLAETLDGRRLLGQPLGQLTPETFDDFARRLRVATIVLPRAAVGQAVFLGDRYQRTAEVSGLTVLERSDRPWPAIERITHRRYRVLVPATGGLWIPTGIAAYPLWRAKSGHGPLATRTDRWGLIEVWAPLGVWEAELVYAEGRLEWLALAATGLAGLGWFGWLARRREPRSVPRPRASRRAAIRRPPRPR